MSFANNLKNVRKNAGLTQKNLANILGISANSISNYENSVSFPDEDILKQLFIALQCTPNDLFEDNKNTPTIYDDRRGDIQNELLEFFNELNEEGQEKVISYVADLVATGRYKKDGESALVQEA